MYMSSLCLEKAGDISLDRSRSSCVELLFSIGSKVYSARSSSSPLFSSAAMVLAKVGASGLLIISLMRAFCFSIPLRNASLYSFTPILPNDSMLCLLLLFAISALSLAACSVITSVLAFSCILHPPIAIVVAIIVISVIFFIVYYGFSIVLYLPRIVL